MHAGEASRLSAPCQPLSVQRLLPCLAAARPACAMARHAVADPRAHAPRLPQTIKDQMDKKFGGNWHVVVGKGFSYEITYEVRPSERVWHLSAFHVASREPA